MDSFLDITSLIRRIARSQLEPLRPLWDEQAHNAPVLMSVLLNRRPALNNAYQDSSNRQDQQDMNEPSQRIGRSHTQ